MNLSRIRRCMIKSEEIRSKFIEEKMSKLLKFWRLQNLATCKFRRLRLQISQVATANFAGCEISQPTKLQPANTAHLTSFLSTCWWFYTSLPLCNFGSLTHICNFLILSTYISSVLLVIKSNFWHNINQSRKLGTKLPFPLLVVIFSSSPFTFLHFLGSQKPLDDDKSRDAWLKPPNP